MSAETTNRSALNVLIVDDEPRLQILIKSTLSIIGVQNIAVESDGQAALKAISAQDQKGEPFDVVICDWNMPVMDGLEFLEKFRKDNKQAVVIMVTARTSTSDFNEAKRKGADYFFMKPLDVDMLKIRLAGAIDAALKRR